MFALWQTALFVLRRADAVGRVLGKFKVRSLANAVVVARTVLEDVDMDVVGVRFVGAWAEHGREPAATGFADRIDCSASITCVSVRSDGERHAVREFETQNICRNSERMGAKLPATIPLRRVRKTGPYDASRSRSRYRGAVSQGKASVILWASHTCVGFSVTPK
jgi:hypothetical protein